MKGALIGVVKGILAILGVLVLLNVVIELAPLAVSLIFGPLLGLLDWAGPFKGVIIYVLLYIVVMATIYVIGLIVWFRAVDDDEDGVGPSPYYTP